METPPDPLRSDPQIAHYLDTLCAWLAPMPPAERDEIRQEVRQHLVSLVVAEQQNGLSRDEAIPAALHRLGPADTLGKKTQAAYFAKMQRFLPKMLPPGVKQRSQRCACCIGAWGVVMYALCRVLIGSPSYETWTSFLLLGAIAGIGLGAGIAVFVAGLPEKRYQASDLDEIAHQLALPPLPQNASVLLRWRHKDMQMLTAFVKSTYKGPSNRVYYPNWLGMSGYAFGLGSMSVEMYLAYLPLHKPFTLNWPPFMVVGASALMFLMMELSAVIISRFLYRRSQIKSPQ